MAWPYLRRVDGKIAVTLDNNVWDFLYGRRMDLPAELPGDKFVIFIPREVEIEAMAIPGDTKVALKTFVDSTIERCRIQTTAVFGFAEAAEGGLHRYGGFDFGTFQSGTERQIRSEISHFMAGKKPRGSGLVENEGDAAVAVSAFSSIVLTTERRTKDGPIQFAAQSGGRVIFLEDFDDRGATLRELIEDMHRQT